MPQIAQTQAAQEGHLLHACNSCKLRLAAFCDTLGRGLTAYSAVANLEAVSLATAKSLPATNHAEAKPKLLNLHACMHVVANESTEIRVLYVCMSVCLYMYMYVYVYIYVYVYVKVHMSDV